MSTLVQTLQSSYGGDDSHKRRAEEDLAVINEPLVDCPDVCACCPSGRCLPSRREHLPRYAHLVTVSERACAEPKVSPCSARPVFRNFGPAGKQDH